MPDEQPEDLVLHLLSDIRERMATKDDIAESNSSIADLRSEMNSLRADVASDFHRLDNKVDITAAALRKELSDQIVGLRRAVVEYHSAVIGHGTLIADLEARMRRVEQQLGIESH